MFAHVILLRWLIEPGHGLNGIVNKVNQIGKRVAEKTTNPQRHVDTWPPQLRQRDHFNTGDASALFLPHGPHPE